MNQNSMREDELSLALIEAQYAFKKARGTKTGKSLLILVSGIELAGKGEAVKQLREWMDPRYLRVKADTPNLLNNEQPFWQPYVSSIPREGQIVVLFGNWYSDLLTTAMHINHPFDESTFDGCVQKMQAFEKDLKNNSVDVIKFWFDASWSHLQKRLQNIDLSEQQLHRLHGVDWHKKKQYENVQRLRQRFTQDWIVIDEDDNKSRNTKFALNILKHLKHNALSSVVNTAIWKQSSIHEKLTHIPEQTFDHSSYKQQLKKLTKQVAHLLREDQRRIVIMFEGMDAAGKGGAIKRIVKKLDPREYEIHAISAPEEYELRHPYLWRFWMKTNQDKITIFDRSWYGRVLVERVEKFADDAAWQRAYDEINRFEQDLVSTNTVVIKFWLSIDKNEQERRFKAREETPHKRFKITDEDWRNRKKWDNYLQAASDMFANTDTVFAPWHIIATDNKRHARLQVLEAIIQQMKAGYPPS
ncbi:phosphate--AMP phosphotransferase [Acinetobacter nectaris]|uniref:phosphate--AMP phosphotransferase n=1 Tax=Acinetobacter nectaris TaxID=1219382 RepID=UPI001F263852|nr:phosphate--AMP phosphotransferase [Acinetobacter nectaris]MCF9033500.1 phosphate--AMP phosphotransferase [Acinetobacter nectaris]